MRQDDAIIACVALQRLDDREWYLSMLAVDPARQTVGAGRPLRDDLALLTLTKPLA